MAIEYYPFRVKSLIGKYEGSSTRDGLWREIFEIIRFLEMAKNRRSLIDIETLKYEVHLLILYYIILIDITVYYGTNYVFTYFSHRTYGW